MAKTVEELKKDVSEIDTFLETSQRFRVKNLLLKEKELVLAEINNLENRKRASEQSEKQPIKAVQSSTIINYAWDESEKFIKIYVSSNLTGIEKTNPEQIQISSDDEGHYQMTIQNFNGKNFIFNVPKLLHSVEKPSIKVKKDMILLMMKKVKAVKWEHLTLKDKVKDDIKKKEIDSSMDKNADPSTSIMNMMKKMYDDGDDDMKRTIAKAWTESRDKQNKGMGMGKDMGMGMGM